MVDIFAEHGSLGALLFDGDWREDYEAYKRGEIPKELPCGVLSEEPIFNTSVMQQDLAVRWLKLISRILDNDK